MNSDQSICKFFSNGYCSRGDSCNFKHIKPIITSSNNPSSKKIITAKQNCTFYLKGLCEKGELCRFAHSLDNTSKENIKNESSISVAIETVQLLKEELDIFTRGKEICRFFSNGFCKRGELCQFMHEYQDEIKQYQENSLDIQKTEVIDAHNEIKDEIILESEEKEQVLTLKMPIAGNTECIFENGLSIKEICIPSQSKNVLINGLEEYISDEDIVASLSKFGGLISFIRKHSSYAYACFADCNAAQNAVLSLSGKSCKILMDVDSFGVKLIPSDAVLSVRVIDGKGSNPEYTSVKIKWYAPSKDARVFFKSKKDAMCVVEMCNGKFLHGWKVIASLEEQKKIKFRSRVNMRSNYLVWFGGLHEFITEKMIKEFIYVLSSVTPTSMDLNIGDHLSETEIKEQIFSALSRCGSVALFNLQTYSNKGIMRCAIVKFSSSREAIKTHNMIINSQISSCPKLLSTIAFYAKFKLFLQQYVACSASLDLMLKSNDFVKQMRYREYEPDKNFISFRIDGDDAESVAKWKAVTEKILQGKKVMRNDSPLWFSWFNTSQFKSKSSQIQEENYTFINIDPRTKELTIFGSDANNEKSTEVLLLYIQSVKNIVEKEIVFSLEEFKDLLAKGCFKQLRNLQDALNSSSIEINLVTRILVIKGDALCISNFGSLLKNLYGSLENLMSFILSKSFSIKECVLAVNDVCSVCFCDPELPIKLSCGHFYCKSCFNQWLEQAGVGAVNFPIKCLFDNCKMPLLLTDISYNLSSDEFKRLGRFSIDDYVSKNLDSVQFCVTSNCPQIYLVSKNENCRVIECSECETSICSKCKVKEHFGQTCAQRLLGIRPPDQIRNHVIESIFTLGCPRCSKASLDFEGCFAIKCGQCPCHFCGWCLNDCGANAHPHVRECPSKPSNIKDLYFASQEEFYKATNKRRTVELKKYLGTLTPAIAANLLSSLSQDLKDLGIIL